MYCSLKYALRPALSHYFGQIGPVAPVRLFFRYMLQDKTDVVGIIPAEEDPVAGVQNMNNGVFSQHGHPPHP